MMNKYTYTLQQWWQPDNQRQYIMTALKARPQYLTAQINRSHQATTSSIYISNVLATHHFHTTVHNSVKAKYPLAELSDS